MSRIPLLLVVVALGCHAQPTHREARVLTLYVAPNGDDHWSGAYPSITAGGADGPLRTLERARDELRARAGRLPPGGATIVLRGGVYQRSVAFVLLAEDSGTDGAPIVYRAFPDESPVIDGGVVVHDFAPIVDPAVLNRLTRDARSQVLQLDLRGVVTDYGSAGGGGIELFAMDRPMPLARWPNRGFAKVGDLTGASPFEFRGLHGNKVGVFRYDGDRPEHWRAEPDGWLHGYWFWDWADMREPIANVDPGAHVISLQPPYHPYGYRSGQRYYAYNLLTELDEPGEWYIDRTHGVLYFWPPDGVTAASLSLAPGLVELRGASNVEFQGITFATSRGTAITVTDGNNDVFDACTIRDVGGWGIEISGGASSGIRRSSIAYTGLGGVSLSGGDRASLTAAHHFAIDDEIHDVGRWKRTYTPAVAIQGVGQYVTHNEIHDLPHQAIAFSGNDHAIERNVIHHVCEETEDAGAIYAGRDWTMRGTVIRDNLLHDITGLDHRGAVGVYLDDQLSGTTVSGNVFRDVARAVLIGGGRDNVVTDNMFERCATAVQVDARGIGWGADSIDRVMMPSLRAMPYQDATWARRYPQLERILAEEPATPRGNRIERNSLSGGSAIHVDPAAQPFVVVRDNVGGTP